MIDGYLRAETELDDRAVHLLFSANRWELACVRRVASARPTRADVTGSTRIEALLAAGTLVLCDRYACSGVAFSATKRGAPPVAWCAAPDAGLPAPDKTIFLDIAPDVQAARGGFGDERYERAEHQARVREAFAALRRPDWAIIDAGRDADAVERDIWEVVRGFVGGVDGALGRLWDDAGEGDEPQSAITGQARGP
jgi:dTMP kinase